MKLQGGCYCRQVRYVAEGDPVLQAQCHCRECQYITGGSANLFIAMPVSGFRYVQGEPRRFARGDIEGAVTREFCAECGTHLTTRPPAFPAVIIKVGSLDDPGIFEPKMAIFTCDVQPFHHIAEGLARFEKLPH